MVARTPTSDVTFTVEPGDEVLDVVRRAFASSGFASAVIVGAGEVEDVELLVLHNVGAKGSVPERTRHKLDGPWDLLSMFGSISPGEVAVRATITRDDDTGPTVRGGLLVGAIAVQVHVSMQPLTLVPLVVEVEPPAEFPPKAAPQPSPVPAGVRVPRPPSRGIVEDFSVYPEENDVITHFQFGRCTVLSSDGERLRLQQDKDGRVREVALTMLRIGTPTVMEDGRKHWDLTRKN